MREPMTSAATIREANPEDLAALLRIEAAAFEPSRRSARAALRRALASHFQRVLVSEVAGAVAGYVIVWPYRRTWRIYNLASDPARRGGGIGAALLAAAVERARRAGARRVVLESADRARLVDFYRDRGFRVVRRLPGYYAEGEDAVRMERALDTGGTAIALTQTAR